MCARRVSLSLLLALVSVSSYAQKEPMKFGKIELSDLEMKYYEKDSSASAIILCDYGSSQIDYGIDQFQVMFKRHTRIKILNKDGYKWADHFIKLYSRNGDEEKIGLLKGFTYNMENGKLVKTKLEKKSIFNETVDKNWKKVKFTMPAVKEGSIIEFTYTINSDFLFNYQGWQFQYKIPVVWSEYNAKFIEYYKYGQNFQGYLRPFIYDRKEGKQTFNIRTTSRVNAGGPRQSTRDDSYEAESVAHRWVLKDIPAFVEEPYITTSSDYISRIDFELERTQFPGVPWKVYRGTWEQVNTEMLSNSYFGEKVKGSGFLNKEVEGLVNEGDSDQSKIETIYEFVRNNFVWNGKYEKYSLKPQKEIFEVKNGNSADINLLLTNMLRKAGLKADPVLISTRGHGMIREFQAVSGQFNFVICKAKIGDKYVLLDATEKLVPFGVLPERCLNGRGFVVSRENSGWVDLKSSAKRQSKLSGSFEINDEGVLSGQIKNSYNGYSALLKRKSYIKDGEEDFVESIINNSDWEVSEVEIENAEDIAKPMVVKFDAEVSSNIESLGDVIYLNPVLDGRHVKNPFKLESREYPISYPSLINQTCYFIFTIPEGYIVDEIPKPISLSLPDSGGSLKYHVSVQGNKITLMSKFTINKDTFVPSEYAYIKAFYAQVISKHNEQVVLKKS